ncbi:prolipoprotein diacylglyceryl transferase [Clostridium sp.]|jgi:phosphatidylglycerol:prolipoprotein diacylglycerol transferase|uniref:prolipoprotein diacylglyceryl transferase n=1 Tax=Clostridium sp. TaxID=1506 RepID=UPI0025BC065E|nr:prolipoprotein diacylglyceryl transferase [Clostridium sp.]MCI9070241.1 prolipoprotein diacylglyceryl transferase [Clostridium sp.]
MNPVAFEIFGVPIRWYGIIIASGVLVAFFVSYLLAKKKGLNFDIITDGFLWSFPFAIIGARLYYVAFEYKNYHSFVDIINTRNGGMAIHGGLIGGLLVAYIFTRVKKINFFEYIDVIIPGVILAQVIGRWGNFMNQEAHGGPVSQEFISKFPSFIQQGMLIDGTYYHPTFLYESVWNLIVFGILIFILYKKQNQHGVVLGSYMILYSLGRFFIEGLRTDSLMFFGLRTAQIISLIGIIIGVVIIFMANKNSKKSLYN